MISDRPGCILDDHSSEHAHASHGRDNGYDEHGRSNVRRCQWIRIVAARTVRLAKHVVPVNVRRAHDVRSAAVCFSLVH